MIFVFYFFRETQKEIFWGMSWLLFSV